MSSTFYTIFDEIQQYFPSFCLGEYDLSNHAPMTALALNQLGASDNQLNVYFAEYKKKLRENTVINEQNFILYLGRKEYFYDYYRFFKDALIQYGLKKGITKFLSQLINGVITASFHPWIRLSYGVTLLQEHPGLAQKEIAISLAYWSAYYTPFMTTYSGLSLSWHHAVEVVHKHIKPSEFVNQATMLYEKLNRLSQEDIFTRQVPTVEVIDAAEIVLQLEQFTRLLYLQKSHLSSLHGITAVYALRILLPYIQNDRASIQSFCQAILALYYCCHTPEIMVHSVSNEPYGSKLDWQSLKEYAVNSGDDHVIKLVYVCWQYKQEFARDEYFTVAERVVDAHKKQNYGERKKGASIVINKLGYWQIDKSLEQREIEVKHKRALSV